MDTATNPGCIQKVVVTYPVCDGRWLWNEVRNEFF